LSVEDRNCKPNGEGLSFRDSLQNVGQPHNHRQLQRCSICGCWPVGESLYSEDDLWLHAGYLLG
jgi:hypothetical protein